MGVFVSGYLQRQGDYIRVSQGQSSQSQYAGDRGSLVRVGQGHAESVRAKKRRKRAVIQRAWRTRFSADEFESRLRVAVSSDRIIWFSADVFDSCWLGGRECVQRRQQGVIHGLAEVHMATFPVIHAEGIAGLRIGPRQIEEKVE